MLPTRSLRQLRRASPPPSLLSPWSNYFCVPPLSLPLRAMPTPPHHAANQGLASISFDADAQRKRKQELAELLGRTDSLRQEISAVKPACDVCGAPNVTPQPPNPNPTTSNLM